MILVNLYGAPSSGKSTTRADIFCRLKRNDINCEEVTEVAKKFTWSKRHSELKCQPYLFAKQLRDIEILEKQVDFIITDSPLLLSKYYGEKYCTEYSESFYNFVMEQSKRFDSRNFYLRRVKKYNPSGRNQTEEQSDEIADELLNMLQTNNIDLDIIDGDHFAGEKIVAKLLGER